MSFTRRGRWVAGPQRVWPGEGSPGDGGYFANTEDQVAEQIQHGVALGPVKVDVRSGSCAVPDAQKQSSDRICDGRARDAQDAIAITAGARVVHQHTGD